MHPATSFDSPRHNKPLSQLQMGFFDNLLKDAFSNDPNLSRDGVSGAIDEGSDDLLNFDVGQKTEVQKRWIESQINQPKTQTTTASSAISSNVKGAPLSPEQLQDTRWRLSLYLTGVPDRDPSNDLYGSRTNVSLRDRRLGLGANLPQSATGCVIVKLVSDGSLTVQDSWFGDEDDVDNNTEKQSISPTSIPGQWLLSPDGRTLRLSIPIVGYKRTVTTKGTIQKIYWSSADESTTQTSTSYTISEGMIYGDINVGYGMGGVLDMIEERGEAGNKIPGGLLRVEKRMGLASSKMVPCGRFSGSLLHDV